MTSLLLSQALNSYHVYIALSLIWEMSVKKCKIRYNEKNVCKLFLNILIKKKLYTDQRLFRRICFVNRSQSQISQWKLKS